MKNELNNGLKAIVFSIIANTITMKMDSIINDPLILFAIRIVLLAVITYIVLYAYTKTKEGKLNVDVYESDKIKRVEKDSEITSLVEQLRNETNSSIETLFKKMDEKDGAVKSDMQTKLNNALADISRLQYRVNQLEKSDEP